MYEQVPNILKLAEKCNTSVIAFICMDYVMARSVVYAAEATNTPALVMLFPEHVTVQKTTGLRGYAEMVKELAEEVKVPIGLHLDHDYSLEAVTRAMDAGFQSVMLDGSAHSLEENIRLTRQTVQAAHGRGAVVEGEIGHVGVAAEADNDKEDLFTKPRRRSSSAGKPEWMPWRCLSATPTGSTSRPLIWILSGWLKLRMRRLHRWCSMAAAAFRTISY